MYRFYVNKSDDGASTSASGAAGSSADSTTNKEESKSEKIMKQQRGIEREISRRTPLLGDREPLSSLVEEYKEDSVYLLKVQGLMSRYRYIMRTRPDGNCFYRAFAYAYFERLLTDMDEYDKFYEVVRSSREILVDLGFPRYTVTEFHEILMETLEGVGELANRYTVNKLEPMRQELHRKFNDRGYSDYIVFYLRLLTSGQMHKEENFYKNFLEGSRTVTEFCRQEVEPMSRESDHIHIIALSNALEVGVRVRYMDRGTGSEVIAHDFPENSNPQVHLLYRPGHYDILYV